MTHYKMASSEICSMHYADEPSTSTAGQNVAKYHLLSYASFIQEPWMEKYSIPLKLGAVISCCALTLIASTLGKFHLLNQTVR